MDRSPHVPHSLAPGSQTLCYLAWLKLSVVLRYVPYLPVGPGVVARGPAAHPLAPGRAEPSTQGRMGQLSRAA